MWQLVRRCPRWLVGALAWLLLVPWLGGVPAAAVPVTVAVTWTPVAAPVTVADVGIGPAGEVWITGTDNKVYRQNGTTFDAMGGNGQGGFGPNGPLWDGTATRVAVGPNGVAWIVSAKGDGFRWQNNAWETYAVVFNATDLAVGANGDIWHTNQRRQARKINPPNGYDPYDVNAVRVAVGPTGQAWVVKQDGSLARSVSAAFQPVPGQAQDIGLGANGAVWITGTDNSISLWTGTGWDAAPGAQGRSISVGPDGSPWVVTPDGALLRGATTAATVPATVGAAPTPAPATTTSRPVVALLCKYADKAALEPRSVAQVQAMIAGPGGLDEYIREQSLGAMNLTGSQTYGWITLPDTEANYLAANDWSKLAQDCAAATPQTPIADNAIVSIFTNGQIGAVGRTTSAAIDRGGASKRYDVTLYDIIGLDSPSLVAHEFGHVFKMQHLSYGTNNFQNSVWDPLGAAPLGDPLEWDNPRLGGLGPGYIAYHRDLAGWIPAARKFTYAGTQQQVTLTRLTQPTTNDFLLAQVPIGTTGTFYTAEVRMFSGSDAALKIQNTPFLGQILPGEAVVIHRIDPRSGNDIDAWTMVANPGDDSASEGAMWRKGKTFTDQANNIAIRIDEFDGVRGIAQLTIGPAGLGAAPASTNPIAASAR